MEITVNFKNIKSSDKLREYVEKKLATVDKLLERLSEARVVFSTEKDDCIVEINLIGHKLNLQVKESDRDMQPAIDLAVDKLKGQVKKARGRICNHRPRRKPREEVVEDEIVEA